MFEAGGDCVSTTRTGSGASVGGWAMLVVIVVSMEVAETVGSAEADGESNDEIWVEFASSNTVCERPLAKEAGGSFDRGGSVRPGQDGFQTFKAPALASAQGDLEPWSECSAVFRVGIVYLSDAPTKAPDGEYG